MADPALREVWPDKNEKERTMAWFDLPIDLRKKYWRETTYGRDRPSEQLMEEMRKVYAAIVSHCT